MGSGRRLVSPYGADPRGVSRPVRPARTVHRPPAVRHLTCATTQTVWTVKQAAAALVVTMLGALYKKIFVWKTGFRGDESMGWYYELPYLVCNIVFVTTGGGAIGL